MPNAKLEALLRSIIACLGRNTETPTVTWDETDHAFSIQVDGKDQGRFAGKEGIIYWAINTIFWYAGMAQILHTVKVNLLDPVVRHNGVGPMPYRPNPNWNRALVTAMVEEILAACFNGNVHTSYDLKELEPAKALMNISLEKYLQTVCSNPDIGEAIERLVYAGGKVDGGSIKTQIRWE